MQQPADHKSKIGQGLRRGERCQDFTGHTAHVRIEVNAFVRIVFSFRCSRALAHVPNAIIISRSPPRSFWRTCFAFLRDHHRVHNILYTCNIRGCRQLHFWKCIARTRWPFVDRAYGIIIRVQHGRISSVGHSFFSRSTTKYESTYSTMIADEMKYIIFAWNRDGTRPARLDDRPVGECNTCSRELTSRL